MIILVTFDTNSQFLEEPPLEIDLVQIQKDNIIHAM